MIITTIQKLNPRLMTRLNSFLWKIKGVTRVIANGHEQQNSMENSIYMYRHSLPLVHTLHMCSNCDAHWVTLNPTRVTNYGQ